jgi:hypothetical protein
MTKYLESDDIELEGAPRYVGAIVKSRTANVWALPTYVPPKHESVRDGADDHLQCKSLPPEGQATYPRGHK